MGKTREFLRSENFFMEMLTQASVIAGIGFIPGCIVMFLGYFIALPAGTERFFAIFLGVCFTLAVAFAGIMTCARIASSIKKKAETT